MPTAEHSYLKHDVDEEERHNGARALNMVKYELGELDEEAAQYHLPLHDHFEAVSPPFQHQALSH